MLSTKDGRGLEDLLLSHDLYRQNPQAVDKALEHLERLAHQTVGGDGKAKDRGLGTKLIQNSFRGLKNPSKYKDVLIELGLLVQTKKGVQGFRLFRTKSRRARYVLTDKFVVPFQGASFEWVGNWFAGRDEMPAGHREVLRKRLSKAKDRGDDFGHHHEQMVSGVRLVDWDELYAKRCTTEVGAAVAALGRIARLSYKPIRHTGRSRMNQPLVSYPSSLRRHLRIGDRFYVGEVDIRACWPTFLAAQLLKSAVHSDSLGKLKDECDKWQAIFSDSSQHPRDFIRKDAGLELDDIQMKSVLIKWLNGAEEAAIEEGYEPSEHYLKLSAWFESNYPAMYEAWRRAGPRRLGAKIGFNFETPLMTDRRIYNYAKDEGLSLSYTFDGFSVFAAKAGEAELAGKLAGLCSLMVDISKVKLGVQIVVEQELAS